MYRILPSALKHPAYFLPALLCVASPALASTPAEPSPVTPEIVLTSDAVTAPQLADGIGAVSHLRQDDSADDSSSETTMGRSFLMEVGFRGRMVSVPRSLLDIWFFNESDPGWAYTEPRPTIRGYSLGLEFVVKNENANGIFYFDYFDSQMGEGYWDDVEEPADHLDGDYLKPSDNLGLAAIGANYAYEIHMVRTDQTNGYFGLSALIGGGLGVAVMVGEVEQWTPDDDGNPSYKLYLEGEPAADDKRIPKVYPMVDINAGLRFNFGDRAVLRVEGGLHTLLYYGATLGIMF